MNEAFIIHASHTLADTHKGLTGTQIGKYFVEYSLKFNKSIKFHNGNFNSEGKLLTKREALKANLMCFNEQEQFYIVADLCEKPEIKFSEDVKGLKIKLYRDYPELMNGWIVQEDKLDEDLITNTRHWLGPHSEALKLYNKAIEKYQLKYFDRNVLDDFRLSLEALLKDLFSNKKSFENQLTNISNLISSKGGCIEYKNMFQKLLDYYSKYQNNYVKHNDKVNPLEVEFVIEITSIFMKTLVKMNQSDR